jgi:ATP-dependent helicase/nuclease subunit B
VCKAVIDRLKAEFNDKGFKPHDFELEIKVNKKETNSDTDSESDEEAGDDSKKEKTIPAYELPLIDGKISVKGKIDRVDVYDNEGIRYIRVVDYKTGEKEFKLSNLLSGINLQMVLYLMAISKNGVDYYGDTVPAGVLYLPSRIGIKDYLSSRNPTVENIDAQKRYSGKLSGMVLNSPVVLNGMGVESFPDYLPVAYKKDNSLSGNYFSQKNFKELSERVDEKIIEMGEALHNGEFPVLPSSSSGQAKQCFYCDYRSICGFEDGDLTNEICNEKHAKVLEMLGGDCNE